MPFGIGVVFDEINGEIVVSFRIFVGALERVIVAVPVIFAFERISAIVFLAVVFVSAIQNHETSQPMSMPWTTMVMRCWNLLT